MKHKTACFLVFATLICSGIAAAGTLSPPQTGSAPDGQTGRDRAVNASYMKLPLFFIKNEGQKDTSILFNEQGKDRATGCTNEGMILALAR